MGHDPAGETIDPEAMPVEARVAGGVGCRGIGQKVPGGDGGGGQRIIDSFAGEWFHHAGGIAQIKDAVNQRSDGRAGQGSDATPFLAGRMWNWVSI